MIRLKEKARNMGNSLEKPGLKREKGYIQTQNDTLKGASKNNGKLFRETRFNEGRGIN
jgi:hypothetical protein